MKAKSILFLVAALGLASCQWGTPGDQKPSITTDTPKYTYKIVKERASDCGTKPDSGCTIVKITYPEFNNTQTLNKIVKQKILDLFGVNSSSITIESYVKSFIKKYEVDTTEEKKNGHFFTLKIDANVLRQDSSLTTIYVSGTEYVGGGHDADRFLLINWNTKSFKIIKLDDIFINGYHEKLTRIAEGIFRKNEKLSDTASLKDYLFEKGIFALNNNFLITPTGIIFLYNEYEVKPYSGGTTQIDIPYSQIESLLRPNTVVTQYLK